ncbi:hypothetical protein H0H81_007168 [Sphagnurus paluster]|uniref:Uncharacterized protein n=1 Tax=Sphagnurus paluster TaxID=117069 RepID=A0A9P7KIQ3_9AGAR|nr:hypothetical protein H0H81_007168 [Sphagnurus paluster]
MWKTLCYSAYPLAIEKYSTEPESWKDLFFLVREAETKRLEEASNKLRNQRLEAEERKREREVKLTDRVPPPKRQKTFGWGPEPTSKTLFQKTRTEASRLQKNMYHARIIPPMPQNGRKFTILAKGPSTTVDFLPPPSGSTSRVTVNSVVHRHPLANSSSRPTSSISSPASGVASSSSAPVKAHSMTATSTTSTVRSNKQSIRANASSPERPLKHSKKDPMASLFVPKHRAYSQRPP